MSAPALLLVLLAVFPSTETRVDYSLCDMDTLCWESGGTEWPPEVYP